MRKLLARLKEIVTFITQQEEKRRFAALKIIIRVWGGEGAGGG